MKIEIKPYHDHSLEHNYSVVIECEGKNVSIKAFGTTKESIKKALQEVLTELQS
jgi:hypothetical protein